MDARKRKGNNHRTRKEYGKRKGTVSSPSGKETIRLNQFIARSGICSRRQADEYIRKGWVSVNGKVVTEMGIRVSPADEVKVRGRRVMPEKKIYILLNKPKDTITTVKDPEGRKTVLDLIRLPEEARLFPVGRLDRHTTGVLLLTNDGELAEKLMHPRYMHRKVYEVTLTREVTRRDLQQLVEGVPLEEGMVAADAASYVDPGDKKVIGLEIHTGQNRVVRRMFEKLGYEVKHLDRVSFAGLTKKGLARGKWRHLTSREISMLHRKLF